jgi:hypothetical protein
MATGATATERFDSDWRGRRLIRTWVSMRTPFMCCSSRVAHYVLLENSRPDGATSCQAWQSIEAAPVPVKSTAFMIDLLMFAIRFEHLF